MKISKSKKQLAKIINENGGWRDRAEWSVFGAKSMLVVFISAANGHPSYSPLLKAWPVLAGNVVGEFPSKPFPNWHQTILSRDEYFYLYQEQGLEDSLNEDMPEAGPSIEQLAADYRNAKDYAGRKQQEADAAEADAKTKLVAYVAAAGSAVGLVLSVGGSAPADIRMHGVFRSKKLGANPKYDASVRTEICDECGQRFGRHCGGANTCPESEETRDA